MEYRILLSPPVEPPPSDPPRLSFPSVIPSADSSITSSTSGLPPPPPPPIAHSGEAPVFCARIMAMELQPPDGRKRVKVYELRDNDWFDRGTGFCTGQVLDVRPHLPGPSLPSRARQCLSAFSPRLFPSSPPHFRVPAPSRRPSRDFSPPRAHEIIALSHHPFSPSPLHTHSLPGPN